MFERGITPHGKDVVVQMGEAIEDYPDDSPYPSRLLLGFVEGNPIHVVVGKEETTGSCIVITAYIPDPTFWSSDFKKRRTP